MTSVFPLPETYRNHLVGRLDAFIGAGDPLVFLQTRVFTADPFHVSRIPTFLGRAIGDYYKDVVRYCEFSGWSEQPPLIVSLLNSFNPPWNYGADIQKILEGGPFQCHPAGHPYYVSRVAAELPLLGRHYTRAAALSFGQQDGVRVLRVHGPAGTGKTYTLDFFRYLAAIQQLVTGVLYVDFGDREMVMQAAGADVPIELYIAQQLEAQVRRRRAELQAVNAAAPGNLPNLLALINGAATQPHRFQPLTDLQQRTRWAKALASELVDQVLYRLNPVPRWWVVIFDTCDKVPAEAQEFVRRLVERAAGAGPTSATEAASGPLRVVLLGDSAGLLPNPVYEPNIVEEDLGKQALGVLEVAEYFEIFKLCRGLQLDENQIQRLTTEALARAQEIVATEGTLAPPWPRALARAVIEKTLPLDALVAQKTNPPGNAPGAPAPNVPANDEV